MTAFPDTSFLGAIYRRQDNSPAAAACFNSLPEPLHVSSLLLYEFRQSVRFQIWLHARDKSKGYSQTVAASALSDLQSNLDIGAILMVEEDWPGVYRRAETLSKRHTQTDGHRSLDLLPVATALHLEAREFLTFDTNQRKLATAEKLRVKP